LSLSPEQLEYARLMLQRCQGDVLACEVLAAAAHIGDESVGFHAQQTVEKALKIALVVLGLDFPRTHDLGFLVSRVTEAGVELPRELEGAEWLTPRAVDFRYDEPSDLDRTGALDVSRVAAAWAASLIEKATEFPDPPR
jgi:HEPN domain-containing protein